MVIGSHSNEEWNKMMEEWDKQCEQEVIEKTIKNKTVLDLDRIYKDGKLFGHEVYMGHTKRGEMSVIPYDYEGKTWLIRVGFDFVVNSIMITVDKINTKKQCAATNCLGFREILALKDGIINQVFDDIVEKLIMGVKKLTGE